MEDMAIDLPYDNILTVNGHGIASLILSKILRQIWTATVNLMKTTGSVT